MARGTARAPSHHAYRGSLGRTQTTLVHVTSARGELIAAQVHTSIDAVSDPELVERLYSEDPARALNVVRAEGGDPIRVSIPVVYHDPAAELFVLVLTEGQRHRELEERVRLLEQLRADEAPVPAYVKDFAVVFAASGLRAYLERRAQEALESARTAEVTRELDKRAKDVAVREGEVERLKGEIEKRAKELEVAKAEVERGRADIERLRSEARNRVIAQVAQEAADKTVISAKPERDEVATKPIPKATIDEIEHVSARPRSDSDAFEAVKTGVVDMDKAINGAAQTATTTTPVSVSVTMPLPPALAPIEFDDEETTGSSIVPQGSDPLTTDTKEVLQDTPIDAWLEKAMTRDASSVTVDTNGVRLALVAGEQLARGLGGNLDLRVLLHRTPAYPLITLVIGPPAALRVTSTTQLAVVPLDIALDTHRAVLASLARKFEITVELIVRGRRIRRTKLLAPLADNVGYILRAAEDHLRGLASAGDGASFEAARDLVLGAGFDLLGTEHPDASEFRDDKLAQLDTAQHLRRAIAMARRFARPSREDYLVCTRGFPLPRWRELRRHVLECAVAWGLWMGPELAQVAVSEGLARSRRDLIIKLDRGFDALKKHPTAFDIDADAADDNYKAIAEEARALGVELTKAANGRAIASDEVSVVSGSIGSSTPAKGVARQPKSIDELLVQLDDKQLRVKAAIELCERADPRAAIPVIGAVTKMSRAEAVRVLGMSVKFGEAAARPLTQGLASSKGFLRHGCALALALLRTEDGTQAVIDLLLNEPTEIWREVARAIGQVGPTALMPLASNVGRLGDRMTPQITERVAWAMAHIAVRGGKAAVETMAGGQSVLAPIARHALELHASAARDQVRVRPGADGSQQGRDVTVNRAFSRRFFEALEQGLPDAGQAGLVSLEASAPMEMLDESDLIEDDEDAELLDDADLIQT